ncbi:MAG TPA: GAF domain-containing protein, partial [Mesorhizobium sp.]|nr:GAF domain-containing protein [Mesorhizobium sp.]
MREQQIATSEVLNIIRRSPADAQPVFDAIVESAARLCGAIFSVVYLYEAGRLHVAATRNFTADAANQVYSWQDFKEPNRSNAGGRSVLDRAIVHIPDVLADPEYSREFALAGGWRAVLAVPLLRDGKPVGAVTAGKAEPAPFSDAQIQLLKTFADQALIAIENVQLFESEQSRTRELSAALEHQTATADILKVIASSPNDVQPVFDAIAHSAKRLIGGFSTAVHRVIDDIDHLVAFTPTNPESDEVLKAAFPRHRSELPAIISLVENGETAQIADSETADGQIRKLARARGWRSATYTPLMYQGTFIGFIVCTRRETGILADHHVQLLRTFADQAVIAIENVRLFDEVNARTEDLRESLQQQTATADVLKVISRSTFDLQTVLDTLTESAARLCGADMGAIARQTVDGYYHSTNYNF